MKKNKTLLIIGNGPSTKELVEFGFPNIPKHIDTFGMGLAYKYFEKINWWPTYYTCADLKVVKNKEAYLTSLVKNTNLPVKKFYFPIKFIEHPKLELIPHGSTGDFAFREALKLGYEKILIIGIDLDYKPLSEATRLTRKEFESLDLDLDYHTNVIYRVREPIRNHPNYFFPEYQEVGDIYSEPRGNSWHLLTWQRAREIAEQKKIPVRNLGKNSLLKVFNKMDLSEALDSEISFPATFPKQTVSQIASEIFRAEKELADKYLTELGAEREAKQVIPEKPACFHIEGLEKTILSITENIALPFKQNRENVSISVIIPCFNAAEFIAPCLESLSRQTLPQEQFEIIFVDDCSTDNTIEKIENFKGLTKNKKIIRHSENKKQGSARNTGLDHATGDYVFFLDCDDFLRIDALELLLHYGRQGHEITASQLLKVRYDKPFLAKPTQRRLSGSMTEALLKNELGWFPVNMLIERRLLERHKIRFKETVFFEDIEFCTKLYSACQNYKLIPDTLYYYVQRDASTVNHPTEGKLTDSVSAMLSVFSLLAGNKAHQETFKNTANSWLRVQAIRVRDSGVSISEKKKLAKHFVSEAHSQGLQNFIGDAQVKELGEIATSEQRTQQKAPEKSRTSCNMPWRENLEQDFSDKVVFFCEVDYHIRSVAPIARCLAKLGLQSIIVDASRSTSFSTNRPMPDYELASFSDLDIRQFNVAEKLPFSTSALAFVFLNDLTYTRALIYENFGFGVPTFGFYEGINDDWNLDRINPRRPYRSVDHLLLPGIYQAAFFEDMEYSVVGLPNVRSRLVKDYTLPAKKRAVINVNFTYGVLEEKRNEFVQSAVEGCMLAGIDYVISQHPADKADLSSYNVSQKTVYDLIDENSILISRFSTTILEALAAGRPAIYHNPIGERVPKFTEPLGAFHVTKQAQELSRAILKELDFIDKGGSIRDRASLYLHAHCSPYGDKETAARAAQAIVDVLSAEATEFVFKKGGNTYQHRPKRVFNAAKNQIEKRSLEPIASCRTATAQLLLTPAETLSRMTTDGDLHTQAEQFAAASGPEAEHFRKVLDWAKRKVG